MKGLNKEKKEFLGKFISGWGRDIAIVILSSILIPYFLTFFQSKKEEKIEYNRNIDALNSIVIGTSRDWIESNFGKPTFVNTFTQTVSDDETMAIDGMELTEQIYNVDNIAILFAYFSDDMLEAYYVTICNEEAIGEIFLPEPYASSLNIGALGEIDYKAIHGEPISAMFNASTNGSTIYEETYDFGKMFNWYTIQFIVHDFGLNLSNWGQTKDGKNVLGDEEVNSEKFPWLAQYEGTLPSRENFKPNTFGVIGSKCSSSYIFGEIANVYSNYDFLSFYYTFLDSEVENDSV
ncbi:MAG: hypothetical protein E7555_06955 [Ruminococcaceae bacterium]|nr:hypothetical protein [Oscillospiraceae bacterium]